MSGATRAYYVGVLRQTLDVLASAGADHLVIGGLAVRSLLAMPLDQHEDVDILIRPGDAERLLDVFSEAGYSTHKRDRRWIYKAARPDVTVDLIFRAGEAIELDDEHLARSVTAHLDEIPLPVPAPEDEIVMKVVFDGEDRQGGWYQALELLRRYPIDWAYLSDRAARHAPRRVLSFLLYAADAGLEIPDQAIAGLASVAPSS